MHYIHFSMSKTYCYTINFNGCIVFHLMVVSFSIVLIWDCTFKTWQPRSFLKYYNSKRWTVKKGRKDRKEECEQRKKRCRIGKERAQRKETTQKKKDKNIEKEWICEREKGVKEQGKKRQTWSMVNHQSEVGFSLGLEISNYQSLS